MKLQNIYSLMQEKKNEYLHEHFEAIFKFAPNTYGERLIDMFNDKEDSSVVVENMSEWQSTTEPFDKYITAPNGSKLMNYTPFKHQVESWKHMMDGVDRGNRPSMVVTTGTGSGKTECFMIPIIQDVVAQISQDPNANNWHKLKAIFIYPLNALMHDQKERLEEFIQTTGVDIKYAEYNGNLADERINDQYVSYAPNGHECLNRYTMRQHGVDILFINPTMLEYMMLRAEDRQIIENANLTWIVLDETHTYTGGRATELSLLLRRVVAAFGKSPKEISYLTSSATIGEKVADLVAFLQQLTGSNNFKVMSNTRTVPAIAQRYPAIEDINHDAVDKLYNKSYCTLRELFPNKSKEEAFELLDIAADPTMQNHLKVKVHYFVKSLNKGLCVDLLNNASDKQWELRSAINSNKQGLVEAVWCTECGNVMGLIEMNNIGDVRRCTLPESDNLFDDDIDDDDTQDGINQVPAVCEFEQKYVSLYEALPNDNELKRLPRYNITTEDGQLKAIPDSNGKYVISPQLKDQNADLHQCALNQGRNKYAIKSFKIYAKTLQQDLMEPMLQQVDINPKDLGKPYKGRQLLSFADSRSAAASIAIREHLRIEKQITNYQMYQFLRDVNVQKPLSWGEFIDMIDHRTRPIPMMYQYLRDFVGTDERVKMALAMLYFEFNRPEKDTLEELGVCKVVYPKLDNVTQLPDSVKKINAILTPNDAKISIDDWKDFLKIFLEEKMRQMHTYYQDQNGNYDIDVHDMRKLFSKDYPRRPIHENEITGMSKENMMYQLLVKHAKRYGVDLLEQHVRPVLNDMWYVLKDVAKLIQIGQEKVGARIWQDESSRDKKGNINTPWRLNLDDLSFDLVTKYWLCPTTGKPLNVTFKGLSPKGQKDCGTPKTIDWTAAPQDELGLSQWLDANLPVELKNNKRRYMRLLYREGYFISKEHTGQIKREEVYALTEDFKEKKINVLSSSTTFEAGVDIGSLQMVSMANVPPMPANYKQRAGRAGRRNQSKSVCITYCDADSNSLRTYNNPMDRIFTYQNPMPMIDMQSPQILQRHVNSLFLHLFLSSRSGITNKKIIDFFANNLYIDKGIEVRDKNNGAAVIAADYNNHVNGSLYECFVDFLTELVNNPPAVNIQQAFDKLIAGYNGKHLCVKIFAEQCKKDITRVYEEIEKEIKDIANTSISSTQRTNADYQRKSFVGVMSNDLLSHLATNQFIPNQGMPVNQVSLGWDDDKNRDLPQRDLFLALSDWAPGRMVPINGEVKTISGIRWKYNGNFIHIYRCQCGRTYKAVTLGAKCPYCNKIQPTQWTKFHNADSLNIIPPAAFIPGDSNRKLDTGSYTQVEIQLIGKSKINNDGSFIWGVSELQNADNNTTPEIIKYNKGLGHGYAICKKCGKAIPEIGLEGNLAADTIVQQDLNDIMDRNGNRSHNSLKTGNRCCNNTEFLRNYFIGGSIQTDYFDMQLLDEAGKAISNEKLVTTMALLLCNYLSENIPCVREDVDFLLHNNNQSFCIFDIVKGGAGYSNKLNSKAKIYAALDSIRHQLNNKMTVDELLTRRTSNYYEKVDLDAARKWLEMEYATRVDCAEVSKKFGKAETDVHHMTKADMLAAISQADRNTDVLLFVQYASDFNYNRPGTISWKTENDAIDNHDICFVDANNMVPNTVYEQLQALNPQGANRLKSVSSSCVPDGVYPLAQVGDILYFTPDADTAYLDCDWATKRIFSVRMVLDPITEYTPTQAEGSMVITIPGNTHIDSDNLFSCYFQQDIIRNFMQEAKGYNLTITYTDKHLKSHLGMVITLQFIQSLLNLVPHQGETSIRFVGEEYWDNTSKESLFSNYPNQEDRDKVLYYLAKQLFDNVNVSSIEDIEQHYRDLVLSYADNDGIEHHLRIMPDGGFQNGWFLDSYRATKFYSRVNTLAIDSVPIYDKNKPLLFHVITD